MNELSTFGDGPVNVEIFAYIGEILHEHYSYTGSYSPIRLTSRMSATGSALGDRNFISVT